MSEHPIKVLLVEDEVVFAEFLREILAQVNPGRFALTHVTTLNETVLRLAAAPFDVVLLDLTLRDKSGLATYEAVHQRAPHVPIVVLTGLDDESLAVQAVRRGAQDYLIKGQVDGRLLARVVRYAVERKRAEEALRQSEEFFRLISENVTDLIAVLDRDGKRLYNSPSYRNVLGDPHQLLGTDCFENVHPQDRDRVRQIFRETVETGGGRRSEYRFLLKDGTVRHVESQGSVIRDQTGKPCKVVVVSRDVTDRIEAEQTLRQTLADLKVSHEKLKAAQLQLIESEKLEAISTFAAAIAHEVKNPLQTIILGVDYLAKAVPPEDESARLLLNHMSEAVGRADAIIRGLLEFSAYSKRDVKAQDLTGIVQQSLVALEHELMSSPVRLATDLSPKLPPLRLDRKTIKHVFINLFMTAIKNMPRGGTLSVKTYAHTLTETPTVNGERPGHFKAGDCLVVAEVANSGLGANGMTKARGTERTLTDQPAGKEPGSGLTVLKKIVELYGGRVEYAGEPAGNKYTLMFKAQPEGTV